MSNLVTKTVGAVFGRKDGNDFSNNGISSKNNVLVVLYNCTKEEAIEYATENNILDKAVYVPRQSGNYWRAEVLFQKPGCIRPMDGGNLVQVAYPNISGAPDMIHIHDRFETPEEYEALSR